MHSLKVLFLTFIPFFYFLFGGFAQGTAKISGSVVSSNQNTVSGATIQLLRAKDSATLKIAAANKEGLFSFERINDGKYRIAVTAVGHVKTISEVITIDALQQQIQLPAPVTLRPSTKALTDVNVVVKKPLVEQRIDRTIVNVDASITNIGSSAMEVLEKSPGITVDREGNISLKGKDGVLVLIDGRPTNLGAADLANLLRSMSSNQMDQIEIMTNPPARYDAAGNAGIINIKTKKLVNAGYNGSVTGTLSHGYHARTNGSLNFNYKAGKINLFTNLSHNYHKASDKMTVQRKIYNSSTNALENYFDQVVNKSPVGNLFNAKLGVDYFVSKKTTIGFALNAASRPTTLNNQNVTEIMTPAKVLESITAAKVDNKSDWNSFSTNLNFRTILDKKGKELTADIDFLKYGSSTSQYMINSYFDAAGNAVSNADTLTGYLPQDIKVYSGRADYLHPISKTSRFEAGVKSSIVRTDNNANYDSIQNGVVVHDFNRSNHFVYEENVNAAYANLSTSLSKKISAQLGLRLENTNANGKQLTTGDNFKRQYTQLFPTAYLQYKLNDKNNFSVNYGRRVRRPNYEMLNPFIRFIDRYTYSQGNPNLKPQISNNIELSHSYKNLLTTTLNYTASIDNINMIIQQKGQEAYMTPSNSASFKQYGISITANTPVNKWWTSNFNFNGFHNEFKGIVNAELIQRAATSFIMNTTQQFKITETFSGELNGRYRSGWQESLIKADAIAFMGFGFSKQMMKNQAVLKFSVRDVFHSQIFKARNQYANVDANFQEVNDTRVASLAFTYKFSKGKKVAATKRTAGSANEEQERIGQ